MGNDNTQFHSAKKDKRNEFYTQLSDIEKELHHYKDHFRNKVIYCNCDDPKGSNFVNYFELNFEYFGLKKLIATHYEEAPLIFCTNDDESSYKKAYKLEYTGSNDNMPDDKNRKITKLKEDGDFRSEESIELLKQADIVVTNPPFSLWRKYLKQLFDYDKKFIILGTIGAIAYKEIFPLIKKNELWLGFTTGSRDFYVPNTEKYSNAKENNEGNKYLSLGNTSWFTNLSHNKRNRKMDFYRKYTPELYSEYDNYHAIEVSKVIDIPEDYEGVMGVPITFLDKYNPDQFEIVGINRDVPRGMLPELKKENWNGRFMDPIVNGKDLYARIFIKHKR